MNGTNQSLEGKMKKTALRLCLVAMMVQGFWCGSAGAAYPEKTIELVIPMPAGAAGDITGRILAGELGKILKQKVVVTNKPGGSFTLGTDFVARAKPDGYTLSYTNSSAIVRSKALEAKTVPYDAFKDLTPLGLHVFFPYAIAVQEKSEWKSFQGFAEYAKKNPGKLRISTAGIGTGASLTSLIIQNLAGFQLTEIPSKGGQQVETMLLGGHVEATIDIVGKLHPFTLSKDMRIICLSKALPEYPDIPDLKKLGFDAEAPSGWFALYGPAGLTEEVKKVLVPAIRQVVQSPELMEKLSKLYYITEYKTPEDLAKMAQREYDVLLPIAEKFGLRQ
jgi:tripartite-type tricarboxylate transporter receptor subunit TctC